MKTSSTQVPDQGLHLGFCNLRAARFACLHWHYSRTLPVGKTVKIAVWEDGKFIGCLIFTPGSCGVGYIAPSLGINTKFVCELQRVALATHKTPVSRIIAIGWGSSPLSSTFIEVNKKARAKSARAFFVRVSHREKRLRAVERGL
jgi:hypothetical protein